MSKLTNSAAVTASNVLSDAANATGSLNVYTFPTSVFTISHGRTTDGAMAKMKQCLLSLYKVLSLMA